MLGRWFQVDAAGLGISFGLHLEAMLFFLVTRLPPTMEPCEQYRLAFVSRLHQISHPDLGIDLASIVLPPWPDIATSFTVFSSYGHQALCPKETAPAALPCRCTGDQSIESTEKNERSLHNQLGIL